MSSQNPMKMPEPQNMDQINNNFGLNNFTTETVAEQPRGPILNFNPPKFGVSHHVSSDSAYEGMMNGIGNIIGTFGQIPLCFCCPNPFKVVRQGQIGLISRFGKYYKTVDPGLAYINPVTETIMRVDVKIQISLVHGIPIVTKDNVNIYIDSVLYWHILDPYLATFGVSDVEQALVERAQTTLRSVLGGRSLQDLIENRETISEAITEVIDNPSRQWVDSAKLMREAAEILNTPAAMQIRYLETLQTMSKTAGTKVMFVPMSESGGMSGFGAHPMPLPGSGASLGKPEEYKTPKQGQSMSQGVKDAALFEQLTQM
ncbi:hypothetical protein BB559_003753 [Furculomyces boomerangus]|uniref:Band 7 domain-containing protein n=1 Tax=Furculomyces boomerangus TaxID=61424 RepID=A0A2T9YJ57_9FUNG|nr:hypothetical protein BB559_006279 [Furculomyces boomerangus]PVU92355.1 hypothetical protein BB559_003753 [Furculomyces boomerangus]